MAAIITGPSRASPEPAAQNSVFCLRKTPPANYVKVVQRIPVRIAFDPGQNSDHLLRPGMSVVPSVRVR